MSKLSRPARGPAAGQGSRPTDELPDTQVVNALQGRAAVAADHRVTVAAYQRVRYGPGASGAIKFGARTLVGHHSI
jgi:hypothetical protein